MLIHLGWTGSSPPPHVLRAVESARAIATGCEVRFHDTEQNVPPPWRDAMDAMALIPRMRSDVLRHAVLRRYGGLWLDADVRLIKNPAEWTAPWSRYTAVRLANRSNFIGTDIIFVPSSWGGWGCIDEHIDRFLLERPDRRNVLELASEMLHACSIRHPEAFDILNPGTTFPFTAETFAADSVVARGFDPPDGPPPARGLGDLVADGLAAMGVTKQRVQKIANAVGISDCGCSGRQSTLNKIGAAYLGMPAGRDPQKTEPAEIQATNTDESKAPQEPPKME